MNRYNKVMDKITVTPEMHRRIMGHIQETDFEVKNQKVSLFENYKRYIALAACLVLCVGTTLVLPRILRVEQEPPVLVIPGITKYNSIDELASMMEFEIKEIKNIPFDVEQIEYIGYRKELAESIYSGSSNSLSFRMAKGNDNISGDYNKYAQIKNVSIGAYHVTLKGNNGLYNLAIWEADGFSYSVRLDVAIAEVGWINIIKSIQ